MTTINTPEEFLRALRENPEWREAVRAQILGDELLNLPAALQALTETVNRFVARQDQFNDEMRQFRSDQTQFNDEQRQFRSDQTQFNDEMRQFRSDQTQFNDEQRQFNQNALTRFDRMESDSSRLKEDYTRREVAEAAEFIPLDMGLQYERNITRGELARIASEVAAGQPISSELRSFRDADLVIVARDGEESKYLAVEVSYTADQRDTGRAIRNARILTAQTGLPAIAVVASTRNTREVQEEIDSGNVHWHQLTDRELKDPG